MSVGAKFTKEQRAANGEIVRLVNKIDRNTRGLSKVVSAIAHVAASPDWMRRSEQELVMKPFNEASAALIQERRILRKALNDKTKQQKERQQC